MGASSQHEVLPVVLGSDVGLLGGTVQPLLLQKLHLVRAHLQSESHPGMGLLKMFETFPSIDQGQ